jgi:stringent starvation protein B
MESSMPPLPSKKAVALDLLERTSLFVHLDPRRPGVIVPLVFAKQPQLVLQIGLNMAIAIPDLEVSENGISCTLSFNRRPHLCRLPWSAIYALIGQEGGGMVWPEDVPPEVVAQQRSAAKKDAPARKPSLRAVEGGASERSTSPAEADSADRQGNAEEASPNAQRSSAPASKSDASRKQASLRRVSAAPQRGSQAGELDGELSTTAEQADQATSEQVASEQVRPELATPELATRQRSETVAPGKRQRPPYLRLVR